MQALEYPADTVEMGQLPVLERVVEAPSAGYERRLRMVGRELDAQGLETITIYECESGFVVRGLRSDSRMPIVLEFPANAFSVMSDKTSDSSGIANLGAPGTLIPAGYEVFFRALGHRLDLQRAMSIVVTEGMNFVAIGGLQRHFGGLAFGESVPLEEILFPAEIRSLVERDARRHTPRFEQIINDNHLPPSPSMQRIQERQPSAENNELPSHRWMTPWLVFENSLDWIVAGIGKFKRRNAVNNSS